MAKVSLRYIPYFQYRLQLRGHKCCFPFRFRKEDSDLSVFGIDIVVTSGSNVIYQRTWFVIDIYLNLINAAVAHVGEWKIDDTVSSEKGHGTDWAIILQPCYPDVISGKINDS